MNTVSLSQQRLSELVNRFSSCRIAVLGDFFLDKYLDVDPGLKETSVETGKPSHQVVSVRCSGGAAGTVVSNLAALGAGRLHAIGLVGDDGEGYDLHKSLDGLGCSTQHLHRVPGLHTPTYLKPRDAGTRRLDAEHSRYDTKNRIQTAAHLQHQIIESLDALVEQVDAVIVADQIQERDFGVITGLVRTALAERAARFPQVVFMADSRRRIREFRGLMTKPNQFEAIGNDDPCPGDRVSLDALHVATRELRRATGAPLVVTRGSDGMLVSDPQWTLVPGVDVEGEIDPTGAGDSATAGVVLGLCAGAELPEAALIGNLVASITIRQIATTGIARPEELSERLALWQQQVGHSHRE